MSKNLLTNGNFELDWGVDKSHRCLIFPVDGEPYETDVGNIFTPSGGWVTWFRHDSGTWDQPEVRDAWASADPRRVHTGLKATLLFTFYRKHDAGFFQRVEVGPGAELRLTAWAHAWSNSKGEGFPHPSDPRWSEGAGYNEVAWTPEEIPPLSGEPQNDAKGNFRFCIGIDPTGGTDPLAATVVWGGAKHIYNGYAQLSVGAVARSGTVTVFLRSRTLYGFRHNDGYWDDAVLETVDEPPSYESTMLVLPQDATPEQLQEIFTLAFPDRRTFGFSHDDAGNLNGTAILYNIPGDEVDAYLDFYWTRYPGVVVKFDYTSDWEEPPSGLLLCQCNPRWKNEKIAGPDCSKTLCQTGCWVSDCAMAQRHFGIKLDATPSTANAALGAVGGFDGCYTRWSSMKEALGLEVFEKHYNDQRARDWLDGGFVCFAEVEPEDFTHFVLVTRYSEGRFWMHDSYKGIEGWLDEHYSGVDSWRSVCPFESPAPPVTGSLVSLHLQSQVEGALDFVERAKPQAIKIFQLEVAKEIKARSPDTVVVLRYYTEHQDWMQPDKMGAARDYVHSFQDSLAVNAEWINYVESWNETICSDNENSIRNAVEFDCCFAEALAETGLPVAPQLLNVAVGNPLESEVELLLPAVEQAIKYVGALGYHAYGHAPNKGNLNDAWQHFAGRALEGWDPVFRAHGLYPMYVFGECGAFATCNDGWRAKNCLDGDWALYLAQIREFSDRIKAWNALHSNRCLGGTLFTSGGWGWGSWEITKSEMEDPGWPI